MTALIAFAPTPQDYAAAAQVSELHLRDELLSYLQRQGAPWLLSTPSQGVCKSISELSNSSASFDADINGVACYPPPPGTAMVNLTVAFSGRRMVLEAWSAEPA